MTKSDISRRRSPRIHAGISVDLFEPGGDPEIGTASILNVSAGGILIAFLPAVGLIEGKVVDFEFVLPTGEVAGRAQIEWINEADQSMGLRFRDITNEGGLENLSEYADALVARE